MPLRQQDLRDQSMNIIAARARTGVWYFVIVLGMTFVTAPRLYTYPPAIPLALAFLLLQAGRMKVLFGWDRLYQRNPKLATLSFGVISAFQSSFISFCVALAIHKCGLGNPYVSVGLLTIITFAVASVVGLAPNLSLVRSTTSGYMLPVIIGTLWGGEFTHLSLGSLLTCVYIFLLTYGKQLNNQYLAGIQSNRELEIARDLADQANRTKSDFLAKVSHELRTPIHGVMGMTSLALESDISPEVREYLTTSYESASSLLHLINDLLDLNKIEAGHMELEIIPFDFPATLHSVTTALRPVAAIKGIDLILHLDESAPKRLAGDPTRIRQILTNLIGNAIKFTSAGSVTLSVESSVLPDGRAELRLAVTDTGVGISQVNLDTIFSPFRQADSSVARKFGGTGLGLAIAKNLAELMNGSLTVTSKPGEGSTFLFRVILPLVASEPSQESVGSPASPLPTRPLRILVADDNPVNRRIASRQLGKWGHTVILAEDGVEAVQQALASTLDLILMDMSMPRLDGLDATGQLRKSDCHTPIVAVTANGSAQDRTRCLNAGMDGVLHKPFTARELFEAVEFHTKSANRSLD